MTLTLAVNCLAVPEHIMIAIFILYAAAFGLSYGPVGYSSGPVIPI